MKNNYDNKEAIIQATGYIKEYINEEKNLDMGSVPEYLSQPQYNAENLKIALQEGTKFIDECSKSIDIQISVSDLFHVPNHGKGSRSR